LRKLVKVLENVEYGIRDSRWLGDKTSEGIEEGEESEETDRRKW
jgi:hypothetical protein